jgi:hypothetical protein
LTILVAILTAVFANIDRDTAAESLFRRTVVIFSGIKSDGLFNYQPPINLLAFCFLVPIRFFLSSRKFHSLNVLCTRIFSSPILIIVAIVEGRHLRHLPPSWRDFSHRCRAQWIRLGRMWNPRRDIDLVFETKHFHAAASEPAEVARRQAPEVAEQVQQHSLAHAHSASHSPTTWPSTAARKHARVYLCAAASGRQSARDQRPSE